MATRFSKSALVVNITVLFATSVHVLFGLFRVANSLNIGYFYLYSFRTIEISVFSPFMDFLIWLGSFVFVFGATLLMRLRGYWSLPRWALWLCILTFVGFSVFLISEGIAKLVSVPLSITVDGLLLIYGLPQMSWRKKLSYLLFFFSQLD